MAIYLQSLSSMVHFPFNHVKELELGHNHLIQRRFSTVEAVQYIGGCSVHRGDNISTVGDSFSTVGDSFSTVEVVQYSRGIASVLWRLFSSVGDNISTCRGITSVLWGITSVLWSIQYFQERINGFILSWYSGG